MHAVLIAMLFMGQAKESLPDLSKLDMERLRGYALGMYKQTVKLRADLQALQKKYTEANLAAMHKDDEIKKLKERIAQLEEDFKEVPPDVAERIRKKRENEAAAQKLLDEAAKKNPLTAPPKTGQVGVFPRSCRVIQIVGDGELLISTVIDRQDFTFWLSGVDTSDTADGQEVQVVPAVVITGTKQYTNTLGATRTVFEARTVGAVAKLIRVAQD